MNIDVKNKTLKLIVDNSAINIDEELEGDACRILEYDMINELGYDSVSLITLVVELEDTFKIEFDDEMLLLKNLKTPGKILDIVNSLITSEDFQ